MTAHPLQAAPRQQALALGLSALVTAGILAGLLGLAGSDNAALLAQQRQQRQQAEAPLAATLAQPTSRS
jgi:hypothetical protein